VYEKQKAVRNNIETALKENVNMYYTFYYKQKNTKLNVQCYSRYRPEMSLKKTNGVGLKKGKRDIHVTQG